MVHWYTYIYIYIYISWLSFANGQISFQGQDWTLECCAIFLWHCLYPFVGFLECPRVKHQRPMAPLRRKDPKVKQRDVNIWVVALAGGPLERVVFHFLGDGPLRTLGCCSLHFLQRETMRNSFGTKIGDHPGAKGVMWVKQTIPQMTINRWYKQIPNGWFIICFTHIRNSMLISMFGW